MAPKIKFDDLISIDDWASALRKVLDAAVEATKNGNSAERLDLQDLLMSYIKRSPAKVEVLDVIARETIEDLALAEIAASLERISSRSSELDKAVGLIDAVTAEARKDARKLQLESTFEALGKVKIALEGLKKLESSLTDPDQMLLQKLKTSSDAIAELSKVIKPSIS